MLILVHSALATLEANHGQRNIGRLLSPRQWSRAADTPRAGFLWAADNDAYSGFDESAWLRMLDGIEGVPGCLFVTCPDKVGDAAATAEMFLDHARDLYVRRLPIGYVGQDGATVDTIPWSDIAALFIGGTTEWKLGAEAAALIAEARGRGKWTHMGRVNTRRRIRYAHALGVDSIDGTAVSMFRDTYLGRHADLAGTVHTQGILR